MRERDRARANERERSKGESQPERDIVAHIGRDPRKHRVEDKRSSHDFLRCVSRFVYCSSSSLVRAAHVQ